jgi:hypothetical protein
MFIYERGFLGDGEAASDAPRFGGRPLRWRASAAARSAASSAPLRLFFVVVWLVDLPLLLVLLLVLLARLPVYRAFFGQHAWLLLVVVNSNSMTLLGWFCASCRHRYLCAASILARSIYME